MVELPSYKVQTGEKAYSVNVETGTLGHCKIAIEKSEMDCVCNRHEEIAAWSIKSEREKVHARSRTMDSDRVEIWVGGLPFHFTVHPMKPEEFATFASVTQTRHSGVIRAVMPGRITSIMVNVDEEVAPGSPLLILEAMKMQNEIVSPKAGKVASIKVKEGATVKKDAILVEIT